MFRLGECVSTVVCCHRCVDSSPACIVSGIVSGAVENDRLLRHRKSVEGQLPVNSDLISNDYTRI